MTSKNKNSRIRTVIELIRELPVKTVRKLFTPAEIKKIEEQVKQDLAFYLESDPAAHGSADMVKSAYLCFKAVATYRVSHHIVEKANLTGNESYHIYARQLSEWVKVLSGVEIHPAARIDTPFMIDHGWGVVIGETAEIGKRCCLLNGVVLGAMGIVGNPSTKRHPTLGDNVQVGALTEILGNITIGSNTIIGPRLKVTRSIPPNSQLVRKTEYLIVRTTEQNIYTL